MFRIKFVAIMAIICHFICISTLALGKKQVEIGLKIKPNNAILRETLLDAYKKETKSGKYKFLNSLQLAQRKGKIIQSMLTSHNTVLVTMQVFMGSHLQPIDLITDTGSGNTWTFSRLCQSCNQMQPRFDETRSHTFGFYPGLYDYHYGKGDVYCFDSFDRFCLDAAGEACTSDRFSFFSVAEQRNLDGLTAPGLIGLSPGFSPQDRGDRFILKLHESGVIEQKIFSFYIDFKKQSMITFGGANIDKFAKKGHNVTYHDINKKITQWWTLELDGFTFGNEQFEIDDKSRHIIVDSGTTFASIPSVHRRRLIEELYLKGIFCSDKFVPQCGGCSDLASKNLAPLNFTLGGRNYFIPWQDYIDPDYFGMCYLKIVTGQEVWILGLNFFQNYYSIFDQENMKVGMVLSSQASDELAQLDKQQVAMYDAGSSDYDDEFSPDTIGQQWTQT